MFVHIIYCTTRLLARRPMPSSLEVEPKSRSRFRLRCTHTRWYNLFSMIYKSGYYGCFKHFYYVGLYMYIYSVSEKCFVSRIMLTRLQWPFCTHTHAHSNLVRYNSKYFSWKCKVIQRFFYFNETHCRSGKQLTILLTTFCSVTKIVLIIFYDGTRLYG